ncbi:MAG: hypothetical protein KGZ45_01840 [Clostridium sp.]|nr:hypothetical protein [Clostridium sp.]
MKGFKWHVAVLAFVLTLAMAVGVTYLRQRQLVNEPLLKRLSELEPVKSVELEQESDSQTVYVTLDYVEDLSVVYRELHEEIGRLLGQGRYRLVIQDERNEALEAAFFAVHLALYEGEQRGNFTEMAGLVSAIFQGMGIDDYKLIVDRENIFLQIREENAHLFTIIKRERGGKEVELP